jgi:hypothetical protein
LEISKEALIYSIENSPTDVGVVNFVDVPTDVGVVNFIDPSTKLITISR